MSESRPRLVPLGVGDAFSALHYTTCLALGIGDEWLLIDCSHPVRKMMREAAIAARVALDSDRVIAAVVTHLHADHSSGLEDFGYYSNIALGRRATLLAHPIVSARLWENHLAAGMDRAGVGPDGKPARRQLSDYFELIDLDESRPVQVGPFSVECRPTIHSIPTTAVKVRAAGRCLGFSADTAFDPTLIDWLADSDLIVHEATHLHHAGVHTPYEALAGLPEPIRTKMLLTHYPDSFDAAASQIKLLREGVCYSI